MIEIMDRSDDKIKTNALSFFSRPNAIGIKKYGTFFKEPLPYTYYGHYDSNQASEPVWLTGTITCTGKEEMLSDCEHQEWGNDTSWCTNPSNNVIIICCKLLYDIMHIYKSCTLYTV